MQSEELNKSRILGPWDLLAAVVAVARLNAAGRKPVALEDVSRSLDLSAESAGQLLSDLAGRGVVCRVEGEQPGMYLLGMPAQAISVTEILRIGSAYRPGGSITGGQPGIAEAIERVRRRVEQGVEDLSVADVIAT